jgi:hypothetical protein
MLIERVGGLQKALGSPHSLKVMVTSSGMESVAFNWSAITSSSPLCRKFSFAWAYFGFSVGV